jgi:hypothetical protein
MVTCQGSVTGNAISVKIADPITKIVIAQFYHVAANCHATPDSVH